MKQEEFLEIQMRAIAADNDRRHGREVDLTALLADHLRLIVDLDRARRQIDAIDAIPFYGGSWRPVLALAGYQRGFNDGIARVRDAIDRVGRDGAA